MKISKEIRKKYLVGKPIRRNVSIENRISRKLHSLTNSMCNEVEREIESVFKNHGASVGMDASISSQFDIIISRIIKKYLKKYKEKAKEIANQIVNEVNNHSANQLRNSFSDYKDMINIEVSKLSAETKEMMKAGAKEAVSYIKSIPAQYLNKVEGAVYQSIKEKKGLQYLTEQIQKISGQTRKRSEFIARDQTKKVHNTLTESRLKQNGIDEYTWRHSGGARNPRKTHLSFNGKKFDLKNPPYDSDAKENVNPGQLINCHCFMIPLILMSNLK